MDLKKAFIVSLTVHLLGAAFFVAPTMHFDREPPQQVKFAYKPERKQLFAKDIRDLKDIAKKDDPEPPQYFKIPPKQLSLKKSEKMPDAERVRSLPKLKDVIEGETFEQTYEKLKKNPDYVNYYDVVREKIRKNAFKYYNRRDTGRVKIIFTISNTGELLDCSVVSMGEKATSYLKDLVLKSIEQSRPFPAFPEGLKDYKYLKLNITVYFKSR
jgi:hypothetical protein